MQSAFVLIAERIASVHSFVKRFLGIVLAADGMHLAKLGHFKKGLFTERMLWNLDKARLSTLSEISSMSKGLRIFRAWSL